MYTTSCRAWRRRHIEITALAVVTAIFSVRLCALADTEKPSGAPSPPALLFDAQNLVGSYYFGDGLGVNCTLELHKDHTFLFRWTGCLGEYDRNNGTWSVQGDVVVTNPERPNKPEGFQGMNVRFVPIQWGERIYLIDENETPGFVTSLRSQIAEIKKAGNKPPDPFSARLFRGNDYYKSKGKDSALPQSEPILPLRYREYYVSGEVEAFVRRLLPDGTLLLNKGSQERLHPGLLMCVNAFENLDLQVVSVGEHTAIAKPLYVWNSSRTVIIGDEFTTGSHWFRPHGTGFKWLSAPPDIKIPASSKK